MAFVYHYHAMFQEGLGVRHLDGMVFSGVRIDCYKEYSVVKEGIAKKTIQILKS